MLKWEHSRPVNGVVLIKTDAGWQIVSVVLIIIFHYYDSPQCLRVIIGQSVDCVAKEAMNNIFCFHTRKGLGVRLLIVA